MKVLLMLIIIVSIALALYGLVKILITSINKEMDRFEDDDFYTHKMRDEVRNHNCENGHDH